LIERPSERGVFNGAPNASIETKVSVVDFAAYAERRYFNGTLAAGTLKSQLTTAVALLSGYGVTLDAGQVNGPTLPEVTFKYTQVGEVFNQLMTTTAKYGEQYVWRIDAFKVLSAFQPSSSAAPFDIVGNTPSQVIGDITVEPTREHYANRIILIVPPKTETNHVETFTGDGSTYSFPLSYTLTAMRYTVQVDGVDELLTFQGIGFDLAVHWLYYAEDKTIRRLIAGTPDPPANGAAISITFDGTFSAEVTAEDAGEIATYGLWEKVVTVDSVPSDTSAQALADAYLAQALPLTQTVKYRTHATGLRPGQIQTINVPRRNVNATAVITDVVTRDFGKTTLSRDVTAVIDAETNLGGRGWRDVYKLWAGDRTGGSTKASFTVGAGTAAGIAGPAPPDQSVQFNNGGSFGGDEAFLYYKDQNSVVCGGGASSITAADFESCQVFGYDNHITG